MKVLVVDDSTLFRRVVAEALRDLPDVEVVGQAPNGRLALQRVRELHPDLITLDMDMPGMDGLEVLEALKAIPEKPAVIVISALTTQGGKLALQALQNGAFDFITKPGASSPEENLAILRAELAPRLKALALRQGIRSILGAASPPPARDARSGSRTEKSEVGPQTPRASGKSRPELVVIGVSTGGPNALAALLPALPGDLGLPLLVVQHMPPLFTRSLAESLDAKCALTVREAADGDVPVPNTVYIAPGGHHLRLAPRGEGGLVLRITDDPPENNCRPAVDTLFRSVASHFPGKVLAVILTGMGSDGTLGLGLLKRRECFAIAQDQASCVVYGMPKAAVEAGVVDAVAPLDSIAGLIVSQVRKGRA